MGFPTVEFVQQLKTVWQSKTDLLNLFKELDFEI